VVANGELLKARSTTKALLFHYDGSDLFALSLDELVATRAAWFWRSVFSEYRNPYRRARRLVMSASGGGLRMATCILSCWSAPRFKESHEASLTAPGRLQLILAQANWSRTIARPVGHN
jgi:hypothetical protein